METQVRFYNFDEVEDGKLAFAVISARFRNQWIFCKHKQRSTFEIPGGRREVNERILDTAKRELMEETGAIEFELTPICVYSVVRQEGESFGALFFAEVTKLNELDKNFEIGEIFFDTKLPKDLTYPNIQPHLWKEVQNWLNLQSAKDEIWDIYDENRKPTGKTHRRGDPLKNGEYHLVVHIWLKNDSGEFLITQRAKSKGDALLWECTGGSAVSGDSSLQVAVREVKEETGLNIDPSKGKIVLSYKRKNDFVDVWLFEQNFDIDDVKLQENETIDAKYADQKTIGKMVENNEFINFSYLNELFELCK